MTAAAPAPFALPLDAGALRAGVEYAVRAAMRLAARRALTPAGLQRLAAEVATEMALRRWLTAQALPFQLVEDAPFTRPGRPRPVLGGRRLIVHTLVRLRSPRSAIEAEPWRDAARVSLGLSADSLDVEQYEPGELLLCALFAARRPQARAASHGCRVAAPADPRWRRVPAGPIRLLHGGCMPLALVAHGLAADGRPRRAALTLEPAVQATLMPELTRLGLLQVDRLPDGPLQLTAGASGPRWTVRPGDWSRLESEAPAALALGWLTFGEARQAAAASRPESSSTLLSFARAPARFLRLQHLRPLPTLIPRARQG